MAQRTNYGKLTDAIEAPDLIEIQLKSYRDFLQDEKAPSKREDKGLQAVLKESFPVESYDGQISLDFVRYDIETPQLADLEALRAGETYAAPLYVTFRLKEGGEEREDTLYMGEIPLMTRRGSFVINGAERIIVSQLHRSPGICFESTRHQNGSILHSFRIIPDRGSWIEVQFDAHDSLHIYLDRKRRRRKFLISTFLRALGYGTDEELIGLYYEVKPLSLKKSYSEEDLECLALKEDIIDADEQSIIGRRFEYITPDILERMRVAGYSSVDAVDVSWDNGLYLRTLEQDQTRSTDEALKELYQKLRPGDPPTAASARQLLKRLFFDESRFNLSKVGRYKMQQKLGLEKKSLALENEDIVEGVRYLIKVRLGEGTLDDIDHLGSRRVRTVGELLEAQCRVGLARIQRLVKERMTIFDATVETLTPQRLINPKALSAVVKDFFGRGQLSQFMDQTNPLSELTHKRRLSALGPGGLNRERAGFEVRDVHSSHYGRICPIETPEGPNIGLISSLSMFARVNDYGFIETPYRQVSGGRVTGKVEWLAGDREENYIIAQANAPLDDAGRFTSDTVMARYRGEFMMADAETVQYMDVSPKQVVSVAANLIPFLEHDDANRALMGSNMQRQAVPLLKTERPLVGTGSEGRMARDTRVLCIAEKAGTVAYASADKIIVTADGSMPKKSTPKNDVQEYGLIKFMRSNAGSCMIQKPIVKAGDKIKAGDVLADGASTDEGEMALGRNVLCAFMPWCGYNFEDAILISEKLVREDVYTSIHIQEFECGARDTKLGPEEITRDIPNVGEEALSHLTHDGIVRVGTEVHPGDILVGKITPKSETELAPEERLLRAIFGEKAADVRDTSLRVPSGTEGIVMDVRVSSKSQIKAQEEESEDTAHQKRQIEEQHRKKAQEISESLTEALSNILLGEKIPLDVVDMSTGDVIIPANRKITKTLLRKLATNYDNIEIDQSPIRIKLMEIIDQYRDKFAEARSEMDREMERVGSGEEMDAGIIKQVKVYIAEKRKLSVGDKMAGRHGNKGVISRIVAEEDMPFLPDGTPVEIVLNPLGVPSRMNVGQVLETHLGWACKQLGFHATTPIFDGISEESIHELLNEAEEAAGEEKTVGGDGKAVLYDGRTGDPFAQRVVVGYIYMLKLHHLVSEKIHARAVGPYSLVTQQPLGGKAQYGGQRFGEMEVWALEAYGAAHALQEILTVKSDDISGRTRIYESIVKGENVLQAGRPESFNVLIREMQGLGLDVEVENDTAAAE
ncbi:DNA-directed RNA polymerase subunit beta [Kiritimatiella glycovorans]|uniref:DNA-directed RNA polymerase subunit beta n=1 Tax=Kiritimatiella glycovorans TaxID=1307763 RepID=A0A0G3EF51_9BACT|nr:DNA-directed RNA polymerase subunit beta [Kiritimatiella glycovorans]AKJ64963.1 DNA-directed RNA polymerase subunit beta [Kiritimatiella glycovorans]